MNKYGLVAILVVAFVVVVHAAEEEEEENYSDPAIAAAIDAVNLDIMLSEVKEAVSALEQNVEEQRNSGLDSPRGLGTALQSAISNLVSKVAALMQKG